MSENPTTVFICDGIILWVSCLYTGPFHSLCFLAEEWWIQTLECSAQALSIVYSTALYHRAICEWLFSRQARHKPVCPRVLSHLVRFSMVSSFFHLSPNLELLNWDMRKPGRRWGNGGGHDNSLQLVEGLPHEIFQTVKETPRVIKIRFCMQVCPTSKFVFQC